MRRDASQATLHSGCQPALNEHGEQIRGELQNNACRQPRPITSGNLDNS